MDPQSYTLISVLGMLLGLILWGLKRSDDKKKVKQDEKKAISDAVASGDNARINGAIDKLRQ